MRAATSFERELALFTATRLADIPDYVVERHLFRIIKDAKRDAAIIQTFLNQLEESETK